MLRLCFNIDLPEHHLQRIGGGVLLSERSLRGYKNREYNRFYPVILCLETLCQINEWHRSQEHFPPLYKSGVFYEEEPPGEEEWLDTPTLRKTGKGDCEDIACDRVAELRYHCGIPAVPCIKFKDFNVNGKVITLVHVMVLRPDGTLEDPSKVLGMGGNFDNKR